MLYVHHEVIDALNHNMKGIFTILIIANQMMSYPWMQQSNQNLNYEQNIQLFQKIEPYTKVPLLREKLSIIN